MYTYSVAGNFQNRISRLRFDGAHAGEEQVLLDGIPANQLHDGGALRFGPDRKLYASTGDAQNGDLAQDKGYLGGKILRLNSDGTTPTDNPFPGSPVYSLGHRNSEGFDWQPSSGALIEAEHGDEGNDEINRIVAGGNYGWPQLEGTTRRTGMIAPLETFVAAPAGTTFYTGTSIPQWTGSFFVATLKGQHLRRYSLSADGKTVISHEVLFGDEFGRLRAVAQGIDGALYVSTSNRDRRSSIQLGPAPRADDDRVIRLRPA
jgi:glucose/arabinose dehydrogenase